MTARRAVTGGASAGLAYFLLVFSIGFILGTIRTLAVAPAIGDFKAVLIELPFMLLVSWFACRWVIHRLAAPKSVLPRATMGLAAFILLLCAEAMLSVFLLKLSLPQHFALYFEPTIQLGLLGQMAFALFPLLQLGRAKSQIGKARHR